MLWFWSWLLYGFGGFLLEVAFARAIRHPKRDRKCYLVLPLCPVYGFGALAILALPPEVAARPALLWLWSAVAAGAVEYAMGVFYERALGVAFWDYSDLSGNLNGKVCPQFCVVWGGLGVLLRRVVHPAVAPYLAAIPRGWLLPTLTALTLDGYVTLALLSATGDLRRLRWYDRFRPSGAPGGSPPPSGPGGTRPPGR